jgi:hypothetical protein
VLPPWPPFSPGARGHDDPPPATSARGHVFRGAGPEPDACCTSGQGLPRFRLAPAGRRPGPSSTPGRALPAVCQPGPGPAPPSSAGPGPCWPFPASRVRSRRPPRVPGSGLAGPCRRRSRFGAATSAGTARPVLPARTRSGAPLERRTGSLPPACGSGCRPLERQPGPAGPVAGRPTGHRTGVPSDACPVPAGPCLARPATGTRADAPSGVGPGPSGRGPGRRPLTGAVIPLRRQHRIPAGFPSFICMSRGTRDRRQLFLEFF